MESCNYLNSVSETKVGMLKGSKKIKSNWWIDKNQWHLAKICSQILQMRAVILIKLAKIPFSLKFPKKIKKD